MSDYLNPQMVAYAKDGSKAKMLKLLDEGAQIDALDSQGYTALHYAVQNGHVSTAKALIRRGANVNIQTPTGRTALHQATLRTDKHIMVQTLINAGADVNMVNIEDRTPLHLAALFGNDKAVLSLIRAAADVQQADGLGWAPLHHAMRGSPEIAPLLFDSGADQLAVDKEGKKPADFESPDIPPNWKVHNGRGYIGAVGQQALRDGRGDPAKITNDGLLPLCSAHRLGELFIPGQWKGREREALAPAQKLKDRLPPYWQERFDAMVDLAPLRREAASETPDSAVARYLAKTQKPRKGLE